MLCLGMCPVVLMLGSRIFLSRKFGYHERNSGRFIVLFQARNPKALSVNSPEVRGPL